MTAALVSYCGHPLVDVGAAVLTIMAAKERPEQLALGDLDSAVEQMLAAYQSEAMRGYLSVLFPNSAYVNPNMSTSKRAEFYDRYARAYRRTDDIGVPCAFTGRPAQLRVYRQHLPLITGEGLFNFGPQGEPGLPVSGVALLCIQAMPLGTLRSRQGRALLVHSSENILTFDFAAEFYTANRDQRLLAALAPAGSTPKSIVAKKLIEIEQVARLQARYGRAEGVTVYHLTNYGTSADVDMYPLPAFMVDFLREAQTIEAWRRLVGSYWQTSKKVEGEARNSLYEQLFDLPDNAQRFVHEFLLGRPRRRKPGPRATWELVDLFLRKVLDMAQTRIDVIRAVAQNLAEHIAAINDARLFFRLFRCSDFRELRWLLIRANERNSKNGKEFVVTFDQFIELFGVSDDLARSDWRLAWDLMLLRVMELLDQSDFLKQEDIKTEMGKLAEDEAEPELAGVAAN